MPACFDKLPSLPIEPGNEMYMVIITFGEKNQIIKYMWQFSGIKYEAMVSIHVPGRHQTCR